MTLSWFSETIGGNILFSILCEPEGIYKKYNPLFLSLRTKMKAYNL